MTTITVEGVIAPYGFSNGWVQGPLYDVSGIFGGGLLTGSPFNVTWTFNDSLLLNGTLTINSFTITFSGGSPSTLHLDPFYVNITVNPGAEAMNTYEPVANPAAPFGIGGGFIHQDLRGYFMVSSVGVNGEPLVFQHIPVPGPILGSGIPGLILLAFVIWRINERLSRYS